MLKLITFTTDSTENPMDLGVPQKIRIPIDIIYIIYIYIILYIYRYSGYLECWLQKSGKPLQSGSFCPAPVGTRYSLLVLPWPVMANFSPRGGSNHLDMISDYKIIWFVGDLKWDRISDYNPIKPFQILSHFQITRSPTNHFWWLKSSRSPSWIHSGNQT